MITYEKMTVDDIPALTDIMSRAFDMDSRIYLGKDGGPDGYNDGSFLQKWGIESGAYSVKVLDDGRLIGARIIFITPEKQEGYLGCMFVDPDLHERGYGTKIWKNAEETFPEIKLWRTETPAFSRRNHAFYVKKCGFSIVNIENERSYEDASYQMEKVIK